jgi:endonuclease/exonuclease/phosphatase family metal-dependent hydrolase
MQTDSTPPSIRVLTLNTHKGFGIFNLGFVLHRLRTAIREVAADIVFLQEVQGTHTRHSSRVAAWPSAPHYEFLADEIWPEFAYGRNAVYPSGHHGNALLSKYPIVEWQNHDVSVRGEEQRGLLHCSLHIPGRDSLMHAICVHLGLKEPDRRRQLDRLCEVVKDEIPAEAPLLVAGDFNDWRNRAHRTLRRCAGLVEVFVEANGRAAKTFPARLPLLQLDRIYVRNTLAYQPLKLPHRPWASLSDHAPLAAQIRL